MNYQGRVSVGDVVFEGNGQFKFALVNEAGDETFWSNDGTGTDGGEPTEPVSLPVVRGLYSVQLGDTDLANMTALSPEVLADSDLWLRIWFDDGVNGFQQLTPDQRLASAARAVHAKSADTAAEASTVAAGSITASQLDPAFEGNLAKLDGDATFTGSVTAGSGFFGDGSALNNIFTDSLVLEKPYGSAVAWGANNWTQTEIPDDGRGLVAVAAGNSHSLGLREDGTVVAWGNASSGRTDVPEGLTDVVAIAGGAEHSFALREDGTAIGWGRNNSGQSDVPGDLTGVVQIAAGNNHSLALREDGTVVAWGGSGFGQTDVPEGLTDVVAISAGAGHSLALREDGTVVAWGRDNHNQLAVPAGLTGVVAIDAGNHHSLALLEDGTVVAWGRNDDGQTDVPADLTGVVAIAGGGGHSLVLLEDGTVAGWGRNGDGQTTLPENVTDVVAISAGGNHSLAIGQRHRPAKVVLENAADTELTGTFSGDGSGLKNVFIENIVERSFRSVVQWTTGSSGPDIPPGTTSDVVTIAAGSFHALGIRNDGTVVEWGVSGIEPPADLTDVAALAAGRYFSLALRQDGGVVAWGASGWVEDDSVLNVPADLTDVIEIAAGSSHSLALREDGTVVAWGLNDDGQADVPAGLAGVVAIAAGYYHSLALLEDGSIVGWGRNNHGQTEAPGDLTDVVAIAAGERHSLALRSDGTVVSWGYSRQVPRGLSDVVSIDAGYQSSVALLEDETVVSWDLGGQRIEEPVGLTEVQAVSAGYGYVLAITTRGFEPAEVLTDNHRSSVTLSGNFDGNFDGSYSGDGSQLTDLDASQITGTLSTARIPQLDASKITSGTFDPERIPNLDASKITSGIIDPERIPDLEFDASTLTSGILDLDRIPDLDAAKITSGTIQDGRLADNIARLDKTTDQHFAGTIRVEGLQMADPQRNFLLNGPSNGLGWYGDGKTFDDREINGPVLFGRDGGALGNRNSFNDPQQLPERMVLGWDEIGNVGIGTRWRKADARLHVQQDNAGTRALRLQTYGIDQPWWDFYVNPYENLHLISQAGGWVVAIDASTGAYSTHSDRSLKEEIEPLPYGLDAVLALRPTSYRFKAEEDDAPRSFGFIAQEVEEILPEMVTENGEYKALTYDAFIPIAVRAIQEQQEQIAEQEERIDNLETLVLELIEEREQE